MGFYYNPLRLQNPYIYIMLYLECICFAKIRIPPSLNKGLNVNKSVVTGQSHLLQQFKATLKGVIKSPQCASTIITRRTNHLRFQSHIRTIDSVVNCGSRKQSANWINTLKRQLSS